MSFATVSARLFFHIQVSKTSAVQAISDVSTRSSVVFVCSLFSIHNWVLIAKNEWNIHWFLYAANMRRFALNAALFFTLPHQIHCVLQSNFDVLAGNFFKKFHQQNVKKVTKYKQAHWEAN